MKRALPRFSSLFMRQVRLPTGTPAPISRRHFSGEEIGWTNWTKITKQLLDPNYSWQASDILRVSERVRWLTRKRQRQSVAEAIDLMLRMDQEIDKKPSLLDDPSLSYWYEGNVPKAIHLLNAVLDSWRIASRLDPKNWKPSEMLSRLEETRIPLNARSYTIIMNTSVQVDPENAPVFCENILSHMIDRSIPVDTAAITIVLQAWAQSSRQDAVDRAQDLWDDLHDLQDQGVLLFQPSIVTYNTYLELLARAKTYIAMEKAEQVFLDMQFSSIDVQPDSSTYRNLIHGYIGLADNSASSKAIALLREMVSRAETGDANIQVDGSIFSALIRSLIYDVRNYDLAEEVYMDLIRATEKFGDELQHDFKLFRALISLYSNTGRSSKATTILTSLEDKAIQEQDQSILPSLNQYREVLSSIIEDDTDPNRYEHAESSLLAMIARAKMHNVLPKPDAALVNIVIKGWSRSRLKDGANRAEALLSIARTEDIALNSRSYQHVIQAWASSNLPEAAERAEDLLCVLQREQRKQANTAKPNLSHYAGVIMAHGRSGRFDASESIRELFEEAIAMDDYSLSQSEALEFLYRSTINAFVESNDIASADETLHRLVESYRQHSFPRLDLELFEIIIRGHLSGGSDDTVKAMKVVKALDTLEKEKLFEFSHREFQYSFLMESLRESRSRDWPENQSKPASTF